MMKHVSLDKAARLGYALFCESAVDERNARDSATVALGVVDGKRMCLGLIVEIRGGRVGSVKSFDLLKLGEPLNLSAESFERLWGGLTEHWHALAALLCDPETFEGLVRAENKLSYLAAVGHVQPYFYRVELH